MFWGKEPKDCKHEDVDASLTELSPEKGGDREFNVVLTCNECGSALSGSVRELD